MDGLRAEGVEAGSVRRETKLQGERQICRLTVGGGESGTAAIITDSNLTRRLHAPVGGETLAIS